METRVMSLVSKVVSFAFLTSTLVSESFGKPKSRGRNRARRRARGLGAAVAIEGKLAP